MPAASSHDGSENSRQTLAYFGGLTLLLYLVTPTGYLIDIQTSFLLKNQLHATATEVSMFRLLTAIPVYFAFAFGLMRDQWNPFGLRDRGYFFIFAPVTAVVFIWMAAAHVSYQGLVIGMLLVMMSFRFIAAAYQGLLALVGQEKLMSGRLAVVWQAVSYLPYIAGAFASGYISEHLRPSRAFFLVAAVAIGIVLMGFWKPRSVFNHTYEKPQARGKNFVEDIKRLVKHRAIYPAILIMFLWCFAPGSQTALQFYLSNELHASDAVYSYFYGIFAASFIPTMMLYGYLCRRVPLNKLLWWGTIVAVPQMIPLAFVHSANLALALAVPIGLLGGIATAAYYDLAMRSCPPGLQGTLMMLVDGVFYLSARGGDLLGSRIYNSSPTHGFLYCVIATTIVYALILPLILLVPKALIATADGEPNPGIAAG
jgi:Na+/melibiose symporter-like transporter